MQVSYLCKSPGLAHPGLLAIMGQEAEMTDSTPNVIVYSAPWCVFCHMVKEYLKGKRIGFKEIDVGSDPHAAKEFVAKTGQMGVPVIQIGEEMILGFDRQRIDSALRTAKLI